MAVIVTAEAQLESITLNFAIAVCSVILTITGEEYTHNVGEICSDYSRKSD